VRLRARELQLGLHLVQPLHRHVGLARLGRQLALHPLLRGERLLVEGLLRRELLRERLP
jgi:hypothetical protein